MFSYRTYGARRGRHDLLTEGIACGLHRVERLIQAQGLRARPCRRGLPKDQGERSVIVGNGLDRQFTADRPNQKWVIDFTYGAPRPGWSGVHMTGMQRRKEELNERLALCCEGA